MDRVGAAHPSLILYLPLIRRQAGTFPCVSFHAVCFVKPRALPSLVVRRFNRFTFIEPGSEHFYHFMKILRATPPTFMHTFMKPLQGFLYLPTIELRCCFCFAHKPIHLYSGAMLPRLVQYQYCRAFWAGRSVVVRRRAAATLKGIV